jgi:hypothetical protein
VHERDVPVGERERDPGGDHRALAGRQRDVDRRRQVGARVARVGVAGHRHVGIQADDLDLELGVGVGVIGHGR